MKRLLFVFGVLFFTSSCEDTKLTKISDSNFIGNWELKDRGILEGIEIEIARDEKGELHGEITKLNDNKYVNLFMEVGDQLLTGIRRNSNYEFTITEKKIAAPLFSIYGQSTSKDYKSIFDGENKIVLGKKGAEGFYVRILD
ncbi:hypothetical protein [Brumimicrobium sp.]|uniref:hypothetical protein n=1 Tax=Brumimicrobium sp. TaxID=2029867 RepID=UPI003A8D5D23